MRGMLSSKLFSLFRYQLPVGGAISPWVFKAPKMSKHKIQKIKNMINIHRSIYKPLFFSPAFQSFSFQNPYQPIRAFATAHEFIYYLKPLFSPKVDDPLGHFLKLYSLEGFPITTVIRRVWLLQPREVLKQWCMTWRLGPYAFLVSCSPTCAQSWIYHLHLTMDCCQAARR